VNINISSVPQHHRRDTDLDDIKDLGSDLDTPIDPRGRVQPVVAEAVVISTRPRASGAHRADEEEDVEDLASTPTERSSAHGPGSGDDDDDEEDFDIDEIEQIADAHHASY